MFGHEDELSGAVFDALDTGLILLDSDRRMVAWNAWLEATSGISFQQALGRRIEELFPGVVPRLRSAIAEALEAGASSVLTHALHPTLLPLRTRAGRELIHDIVVRPLGRMPHSRCLVQVNDVTVAVQRERVLRQRQNARYDAVVNSAPDAILTLDADGVIQLANPAAARELGYAQHELVGGRVAALLESREDWDEVWAAIARGEILSRPVEIVALRKDGSLSHLEASASRWLSDSRIFVTAILRDVNERHKAEEALRDLNQMLERRVEERTAELMEAAEQLRQAQKMDAMGQLTGGVAHDFNNLLTVIRSSVDFLQRPNLSEERRRRYTEAISETVTRASKLTSQLLAFARRQTLKPEVFNVSERMRSIQDMLRTISGSRIQLVTEIESESCFVETDVGQFETALVNMVVNARDAMDGEGCLIVRLSEVSHVPGMRGHASRQGRFVAVSLTDTGSGIASDKLWQIFEPFFTTKEVGKGTGLGLSQVFGFAKQSGGDVDVESEVGRGTTFTLYLPQVDRSMVAVEPRAGGDRSEVAEHGQGRRVLVVEDNIEVGQFSTQLLQDLGYETFWAANADEALKVLETESAGFDVVFTDVVMPGMNGLDLGHEIERRYPGLPVVLTSGYSHVLAQEGPHGFELLHKPYAAAEVSRVLRRVIQRR
jgi:PAS domain S-box-containing protein